jgi:FtsZ-binding cell division protein ZapB
MAAIAREEEIDSLSYLEERITRAVELVGVLKQEKEQLAARLGAAEAERDAALAQAQKAAAELDGLRNERKQVRTRIEKLLGQMDLLSAQ